jgi:hypothetical protein
MANVAKQSVTRTITVSDLTPQELASIFANYSCDEQAAFFDALVEEGRDWPGTGWCMQSSYFVPKVGSEGQDLIAKFAAWLDDRAKVFL